MSCSHRAFFYSFLWFLQSILNNIRFRTKKKGNPICVPRNVNFDVSKWSDSRVLTESRCNQPSPPRSGGSRGPHVPWDVEGASLLIKSPERKSYRRTTENNRRRKTITGYAPSIHNGFSDRGSKSAQKPAPGSQIRRLTATPGMKNAASESKTPSSLGAFVLVTHFDFKSLFKHFLSSCLELKKWTFQVCGN